MIDKKNEDGKKLKDAEFTLYQDKECKKKITGSKTNENGEAKFEGLAVGKTYFIKETKAPQGIQNSSEFRWK